jgi:hypothetical protein
VSLRGGVRPLPTHPALFSLQPSAPLPQLTPAVLFPAQSSPENAVVEPCLGAPPSENELDCSQEPTPLRWKLRPRPPRPPLLPRCRPHRPSPVIPAAGAASQVSPSAPSTQARVFPARAMPRGEERPSTIGSHFNPTAEKAGYPFVFVGRR